MLIKKNLGWLFTEPWDPLMNIITTKYISL